MPAAASFPIGATTEQSMVLAEIEQLDALKQAMTSIGLTLVRQELSPFERALVHEVQSRLAIKNKVENSSAIAGPWWLAGSVICRDEDQTIIQVFYDGEPEQQRNYAASLCRLMNRSEPLSAEAV